MANIEKLTNQILSEAKAQRDKILADAQSEKNKILEKRISEARNLEKELIERGKREAQARKERIISGAHLKIRNEKLTYKQEIIEKVFDSAIEELSNINEKEFKTFIKERVLTMNLSGKQNLILNNQGKNIIDEEFIKDLNTQIKNNGNNLEILISNETRDFKGGFILEENGIEINNTFEALVNSFRDDLEFQVAKVLF